MGRRVAGRTLLRFPWPGPDEGTKLFGFRVGQEVLEAQEQMR